MIKILLFTFEQALLSTLISFLGGWLTARALWQCPQWRPFYHPLLSLCQNMPSVLVILCLILSFGTSGIFTSLTGIQGIPLYGLTGIVAAHVLLHLPLIAHQILEGYDRLPLHYGPLYAQLSPSLGKQLILLEGKALSSLLKKSFQLSFCLTFTSLTLILALGGGPKTTTLPVLVYQATVFCPDLGRALGLLLLQTGICYALLRTSQGSRSSDVPSLPKQTVLYRPINRILALLGLVSSLAILLFPLFGLGINISKFDFSLLQTNLYQQALKTSLILAFTASSLALGLAVFLLFWTSHFKRGEHLVQRLSQVPLFLPSYTLTALAIFLFPGITGSYLGIGAIKIFLCLPFAVHFLRPLFHQMASYQTLITLLGLSWPQKLRWVWWPLSQGVNKRIFGLLACYSLGEINAVFMLGGGEIQTLPLQIYTALGHHRLQEAITQGLTLLAVMAFILLITQSPSPQRYPHDPLLRAD